MAKITPQGERWRVDYYSAGIRYRPLFESRREAEEFKRKLLLGDNAPSSRKTIREAIKDYEANFSSVKAAVDIEKKYFETFLSFMRERKLLYPHEIELLHLQTLQRELRDSVSGSTVNRQFNTYKHFIKQCDLWGLITKTPLKGLKRVTEAPRTKALWTRANIETFFSSLETQWHKDLSFLFSRTTARPSELVRMTREDFDATAGTLRVRTYKGNGDLHERKLKLSIETVEYIRAMLTRRRKSLSQDLIVDDRGRPVTPNAARTAMGRAVRAAGLEGLEFYAIKHTVASWLRDQGTDLETIRQILGHSRLNIIQKYLQNLSSIVPTRKQVRA